MFFFIWLKAAGGPSDPKRLIDLPDPFVHVRAKERAFNRIAAIANGGILILHVSFKGMPSKHVKFMRTIGEQGNATG